jgi:hypothetical protein
VSNAAQSDRDSDLIGDACDCEPDNEAIAAYLLINDPLGANTGQFAPADGFGANWDIEGGGLVQSRLANEAADAAFLSLDPQVDVRVQVTGASTGITDFDTNDLRQIFIVARASSSAEAYTAEACGIEVVDGLSPTQKTSVISQTGDPVSPVTTSRQRVDRAAVDVDEPFGVTMDLRGDTMSCAVTVAGVATRAEFTGLDVRPGAVGFFTRETQARLTNVKVCAYPRP